MNTKEKDSCSEFYNLTALMNTKEITCLSNTIAENYGSTANNTYRLKMSIANYDTTISKARYTRKGRYENRCSI